MDWMRVLPIAVQFGVGGLLGLIGIWCGLSSGYLDLKLAINRRLLGVLIGGYVVLLAVASFFTFVAPFIGSEGGAP